MKCLIVIPSLARAGAETQTVDLANGLSAAGHSVYLCSFEQNVDLCDRVADSVEFRHFARRGKYDLSVVKRISEFIDEEGVEVVQGVLQFATLQAWLASRWSRTKPPVIAAVHTTINRGPKQEVFDRFLYRRLLRRMSAIIFVCNYQKAYWMRKYPELVVLSKVVHNGVVSSRYQYADFSDAAARLRADLDLRPDTFVFGCVAAFRPEKGHRLLLDALASIDGDVSVVFAGDGSLRSEMERYAASAGLRDQTRFLGNIPDTRPLIAASNATVLASTAVETFSMAMLESMAMAVPMVAPNIGGLSEAIVHNETGLLFPIGDIDALSRCMAQLVKDPAEAAKLGSAAAEKVAQEFNFSKMVSGTERILLDVVADWKASISPD